jgi:hypothetical protein
MRIMLQDCLHLIYDDCFNSFLRCDCERTISMILNLLICEIVNVQTIIPFISMVQTQDLLSCYIRKQISHSDEIFYT